MDSHKISGNDCKQIEEVNTREERREREIYIEGGRGKRGFWTVLKSGECVSSSSLLLPCLLNWTHWSLANEPAHSMYEYTYQATWATAGSLGSERRNYHMFIRLPASYRTWQFTFSSCLLKVSIYIHTTGMYWYDSIGKNVQLMFGPIIPIYYSCCFDSRFSVCIMRLLQIGSGRKCVLLEEPNSRLKCYLLLQSVYTTLLGYVWEGQALCK